MFDAREPLDAPQLQADGIVVRRGGAERLAGLSLAITPGATTAILGPNGAGKSLTLRVLHGLIRPCGGAVTWDGAALCARARRAQAMVFQKPALLRRSAIGNLLFALKATGVRGRATRRAAAEAALGAVGLADLAGSPAHALSGGEQQRLELARALATRPSVLLLDEPTAHLDPTATALIEDALRRARDAGVTVVLVTHDVGQARRLADRVVFLHRGRVAEDRAAADFFAGPASPAAAAHLAGRLPLGAL